jgi:predicted MFS family arabinose efflux permease
MENKIIPSFSGYQKFVVAVLTFLQFTVILDFMILSPLGAILMPTLKITPVQFSHVVSVYAFSAGIAGMLSAGFADKFDRKKFLLFFYGGFIIGTLCCGLAESYETLLLARLVTGLFGGVIGSVISAITTDLFPFQMRGRVLGFMQTAFAASQVLGLPLGIYLANKLGWHSPFVIIVGVATLVGIVLVVYLRPIDSHLNLEKKESALHHFKDAIFNPLYLQAFATMALLSTGGFMLMPFGSDFTVHNLGIDIAELPKIYIVTGVCSILIGPLVGRMSDRIGKFRMFVFGSSVSIVMVSIYTHLGATPLVWVMVVNAAMFVGIFSRMIPAQALMSAVPEAVNRGSFMAIGSSVQQFSGGLAALLAGLLVEKSGDGSLLHFENIGYAVIGASVVTLFMLYKIRTKIESKIKSRSEAGLSSAPALSET